MKSGLKVPDFMCMSLPAMGYTPYRDEKRTESWLRPVKSGVSANVTLPTAMKSGLKGNRVVHDNVLV